MRQIRCFERSYLARFTCRWRGGGVTAVSAAAAAAASQCNRCHLRLPPASAPHHPIPSSFFIPLSACSAACMASSVRSSSVLP